MSKKTSAFDLLFPRVRAELLRFLLFDPTRTRSVRELARSSDLALRIVQREIALLQSAGLIVSSCKGPGHPRFIRANRDHRLFPALQQLVIKGALDNRPQPKAKTPRQRWRWSVRRR